MALSPDGRLSCESLRKELEAGSSGTLERLAAALVGDLLGVRISVAPSGFQHGGDAGPAGRGERRFRIECKRYKDSSTLSTRELLGEIDQAIARDEALEAWVLVSTQDVGEKIVQGLHQKGESVGVPVVVLDWDAIGVGPLAALCANAPDLVQKLTTETAAEAARHLSVAAGASVKQLRRDLETWALGFEELRARSHRTVLEVWRSPKEATAGLGQNAAGGAEDKRIRRQSVHDALDCWWRGAPEGDSPAAVVGLEGVGKTWAVLDWISDRLDDLPIALVVPSSSWAGVRPATPTSIKEYLADRLYEISGVRDRTHWLRRLDRLLKRPADEGPVLVMFVDGLNQQPSVEWLRILKALQAPAFEGRIRVVVSTRPFHFEGRLSRLRGLISPPVPIQVERYDDTIGGELERMLALEQLSRDQLSPDLLDLARTPRLFRLVVRLRARLMGVPVTVHRLLWEYGRDTLGVRSGHSFSESEWRAWLQEIAGRYRDGIRGLSLRELGDTAGRPDLSHDEVHARLSDIIDGSFAKEYEPGKVQLTPAVVAHALGAALAMRLVAHTDSFDAAQAELERWFDPISGLDQTAEILRASVSILVESGADMKSPAAGALVTAWLHSQNVPDDHQQEIVGLARHLLHPLLDAVEQSGLRAHSAARAHALHAIRTIPQSDPEAHDTIVARVLKWLTTVSRDVRSTAEAADVERVRADRWVRLIGIDRAGPITVLGVDLILVDNDHNRLDGVAAGLLHGFPLRPATAVLEAAALQMALRATSEPWNAFKWLCYLNALDREDTARAIRSLAEEIARRPPENGVNAALPARVAALLLRLTGDADDEDQAANLEPGLERRPSYEEHYLRDPARSGFRLERRHARLTLEEQDLRLIYRIQRTRTLLADPTLEMPSAFVAELQAASQTIDAARLTRAMGMTEEDHAFEEVTPALARCAPEQLGEIVRGWLRSFAGRKADERWPCAVTAPRALMLVGPVEAAAAKALRLSATDSGGSQESFATSQLLLLEVHAASGAEQASSILETDLAKITVELGASLAPIEPAEVDALIARYGESPVPRLKVLLTILGCQVTSLSDGAWSWVLETALHVDPELRGTAFRTLARADARRFGRDLWNRGWSWSAGDDYWVAQYGSVAMAEATGAIPFEAVAQRLVPWSVIDAARRRGSDPAEVRLAATLFGEPMTDDSLEVPDPGATVLVERTERAAQPFRIGVDEPSIAQVDNAEAFARTFDTKGRVEALNRTTRIAAQRIDSARRRGAQLYLVDVSPADTDAVFDSAPNVLARWLEGMAERSTQFQHRVHLAEAAYLAICETLLRRDPHRGAVLWRSLAKTLATRFTTTADVDELVHMLFRVPDSPPVHALRNALLDLDRCHTDAYLFEIAVAAAVNGKSAWLQGAITLDQVAAEPWKRMRAVVLEGFTVGNALPVDAAWPSGEIETVTQEARRSAAHFRYMEACARHWWRAFLAATTPDEAYSAWELFMGCADRRAHAWMSQAIDPQAPETPLGRSKAVHVRLNRQRLNAAMKKQEDKLDRRFLGREVSQGVWPWLQLAPTDDSLTDN